MAPRVDLDAHVRRMIRLHFHPDSGAPYWLQRQAEVGIRAVDDIRGANDLDLLGPMDPADLSARPVLDFVPRSQRRHLAGALLAETGGATGAPKRTLFSQSEFTEGFVNPFVRAAELADFPRGGAWLWLGPSGPHIIGQAAAACASALGSSQPFSVDFDPRWFRKLPPDSLGRQRYLEHLLDQAHQVIDREPIDVLFTTPAVLARLAERMSDAQRERVRGVHYGGMRVEPALLRAAQAEWFPHAVHLAGYGNSLFGVCMEFGGPSDRSLCYYPYGCRHLVRVADDGRVWMSRLDPTVLIANLPERDAAQALPPPSETDPMFGPGVRDPHPYPGGVEGTFGIY